ncbi:MAG: Trk system potassium transporter TrkA [Alphaproteobacteria bacterium]
MKVVICGAGLVGRGIAETLAAEGNDLSIIDTSPALIGAITEALDVKGFVGHGAHPDMLAQAGAEQADMIIAVTRYDEVNMVACQIASTLFNVPLKIARVRAQTYLEPQWRDLFARDRLAVDVVISPEVEVGEMVMRRLALPGSTDTLSFCDDKVTVAGISCEPDCPIIDTPLRQLTELFPDLKAVIVGISRNGQVLVPGSDDTLSVGDQVYVVAETAQIERVLSIFGHDEVPGQRVIIAGGGNIGLYVARQIEARNPKARLRVIESARDRAEEVAASLKNAIVIHGSALDAAILTEADITQADTLLAVTNDDQINLLAGIMGKRLGAQRVVSLINNPSWPPITRGLGIDAHVNPRQITVSRVLQHVRRGRIRRVHSLLEGRAEAIEAEALETSPLVGKPLRLLDLPDGVRIGAIIRQGVMIIPSGSVEIRARDRVVVFALRDKVKRVEQLFRVSLEFF